MKNRIERLCEITHNKEVSSSYFRIGLKWKTPRIAPGQFVMLRVTDGLDPLLRRPFGIYNVINAAGKASLRGTGIELLYKVVGRGTRILSLKKPGECVDVLGPLGNGWPLPRLLSSGKNRRGRHDKIIMAGGGMGIAPLYLLANKIKTGVVLFGGKGRAEAGLTKAFKGHKIRIATEDGSVGKKGFVTELLKEELAPGSVVCACGPVRMLKAVAALADGAGVDCYVSLESTMACGIGVCLGCAVKSGAHALTMSAANKDYRMVCSDGPVFLSRDIDWEAL